MWGIRIAGGSARLKVVRTSSSTGTAIDLGRSLLVIPWAVILKVQDFENRLSLKRSKWL
jgi:hypothetical protein